MCTRIHSRSESGTFNSQSFPEHPSCGSRNAGVCSWQTRRYIPSTLAVGGRTPGVELEKDRAFLIRNLSSQSLPVHPSCGGRNAGANFWQTHRYIPSTLAVGGRTPGVKLENDHAPLHSLMTEPKLIQASPVHPSRGSRNPGAVPRLSYSTMSCTSILGTVRC